MACLLMDSRVAPARKEVKVNRKLNWLVYMSIIYSYAKEGSWFKLDRCALQRNRKNGELQRFETYK